MQWVDGKYGVKAHQQSADVEKIVQGRGKQDPEDTRRDSRGRKTSETDEREGGHDLTGRREKEEEEGEVEVGETRSVGG